jgi:D-tyrosyl-tRNA(Tyr) deacylase
VIAVLQRAASASVRVENRTVGEIGGGLLILLGVATTDSERDAEALVRKIVRCRIFGDEAGKMNRSLLDVGGAALVVSNFTLLANYTHGNRPDYFGAARPDTAVPLYERFCALMRAEGVSVATGEFGADMRVMLEGDGPVTIVMDSKELISGKERA